MKSKMSMLLYRVSLNVWHICMNLASKSYIIRLASVISNKSKVINHFSSTFSLVMNYFWNRMPLHFSKFGRDIVKKCKAFNVSSQFSRFFIDAKLYMSTSSFYASFQFNVCMQFTVHSEPRKYYTSELPSTCFGTSACHK